MADDIDPKMAGYTPVGQFRDEDRDFTSRTIREVEGTDPTLVYALKSYVDAELAKINLTGTAAGVSFTPYGSLTSTFVQGALEELQDEKLAITDAAGVIDPRIVSFLTTDEFREAVQDRVAGLLAQGQNITLDYDDANNRLVISAPSVGTPPPAPAATTLDALTDVTIVDPQPNQTLLYTGTSWVNTALPDTSGAALSVLEESTETVPITRQLNFVGSGVTVRDDGEGRATIIIAEGTAGDGTAGGLSYVVVSPYRYWQIILTNKDVDATNSPNLEFKSLELQTALDVPGPLPVSRTGGLDAWFDGDPLTGGVLNWGGYALTNVIELDYGSEQVFTNLHIEVGDNRDHDPALIRIQASNDQLAWITVFDQEGEVGFTEEDPTNIPLEVPQTVSNYPLLADPDGNAGKRIVVNEAGTGLEFRQDFTLPEVSLDVAGQPMVVNADGTDWEVGEFPELDLEAVRDEVSTFLVQGEGITLVHDDETNTLTVSATPVEAGLDIEAVRDAVASFLVQGTGITLEHNDEDDTLTINTTVTGGIDGIDGEGVPVGGLAGQILAKASEADFDTIWIDAPTGGGSGGSGGSTGGTRVKAAAVVNVSGTTPTVATGLNVASVTRTALGRYRATFTTPLDSINYGVNASCRFGAFDDNWTAVVGIDRHVGSGFATTHIDLLFTTANGAAASDAVLYDPVAFSVEIFDAAQQAGGGSNVIDYDVGFAVEGKALGAEVVGRYLSPRAWGLAADAGVSVAEAGTPATGAAVFSLHKEGVEFGTVTFAAGAFTGTIALTGATSFIRGDTLTIHAPTAADNTLADIAITLCGTRA